MTLDLDAIKARVDKAHQHVGALCMGEVRWTMHIPIDPARDSDLIITEALCDADVLVAEIERLRSQRDKALALCVAAEASGNQLALVRHRHQGRPRHLRRTGGEDVMLDLEAVKAEFLRQCGPCDYGLAYPCNCPTSDYRPTMLRLITRIEDLEHELSLARQHLGRCETWQSVCDDDRAKARSNQ